VQLLALLSPGSTFARRWLGCAVPEDAWFLRRFLRQHGKDRHEDVCIRHATEGEGKKEELNDAGGRAVVAASTAAQ